MNIWKGKEDYIAIGGDLWYTVPEQAFYNLKQKEKENDRNGKRSSI